MITTGDNMKKGAYSHTEYTSKVKEVNPHIRILSEFIGVENKVQIECKHQEKSEVYAYRLLKPKKHCCKQSYFESKIGKNKKSISERIDMYSDKVENFVCFTDAFLQDNQKMYNIYCKKHDIHFDQWFQSLARGIGCPQCGKEKKKLAGIRMLKVARKKQLEKGSAKFVSKSETNWLNELDIPIRQHWLDDVKYSVDGFDPSTNTVYLYHGRFWHGCPVTFDPEEVHPILKVKMKQLYEQTIAWETKIAQAGYNLITQWGK